MIFRGAFMTRRKRSKMPLLKGAMRIFFQSIFEE